MIELVLPYPVSANRYWRRYLPKGHRSPVTTLSSEARFYKRDVGKIAQLAGIERPLCGRLKFEYALSPKCPKDAARRMKRDPGSWDDSVQCIDLDNAQKVLIDALEGIAYPDDRMIWKIVGERIKPEDENGKVYVRITPVD